MSITYRNEHSTILWCAYNTKTRIERTIFSTKHLNIFSISIKFFHKDLIIICSNTTSLCGIVKRSREFDRLNTFCWQSTICILNGNRINISNCIDCTRGSKRESTVCFINVSDNVLKNNYVTIGQSLTYNTITKVYFKPTIVYFLQIVNSTRSCQLRNVCCFCICFGSAIS